MGCNRFAHGQYKMEIMLSILSGWIEKDMGVAAFFHRLLWCNIVRVFLFVSLHYLPPGQATTAELPGLQSIDTYSQLIEVYICGSVYTDVPACAWPASRMQAWKFVNDQNPIVVSFQANFY